MIDIVLLYIILIETHYGIQPHHEYLISILKIPDDSRLFLDTNDSGASSTFICGSAQELTPDLSLAGCSKPSAITGKVFTVLYLDFYLLYY